MKAVEDFYAEDSEDRPRNEYVCLVCVKYATCMHFMPVICVPGHQAGCMRIVTVLPFFYIKIVVLKYNAWVSLF